MTHADLSAVTIITAQGTKRVVIRILAGRLYGYDLALATRRCQTALGPRITAQHGCKGLSGRQAIPRPDQRHVGVTCLRTRTSNTRRDVTALPAERSQQAVKYIAQQARAQRHRQRGTGATDGITRPQTRGILVNLDDRLLPIDTNHFTEQLLLPHQRGLIDTECHLCART